MEDGVDTGRTGNAAGKQGQVAERAASEASQVSDTAKDQARQVKDEVATQARGLVDQAKTELRDQGRSQADHAAQAIRRVSDQAQALAAGRVDEAGNVGEYVRKAGNQVRHVADKIDERGIEGVVEDVQTFARRRPGTFLLGCAAAGFVTGRLLRGGAASSADSSGAPSATGTPPTQATRYQPTA
jgi:hydroxypyruvate isomerase